MVLKGVLSLRLVRGPVGSARIILFRSSFTVVSTPTVTVTPASYQTSILTTTPWANIYPLLEDRETGAQRHWVVCLSLKSKFRVTKLNGSQFQRRGTNMLSSPYLQRLMTPAIHGS